MGRVVTESDSYPYRGMPLNPPVVLELVAGFLERPMSRPEIVKRVTEIHRTGGGSFVSDGHLISAVKKGLTNGVTSGRLVRPRSGWYALGQQGAVAIPELEPAVRAPATNERGFDCVVGRGSGQVYAWYYDTYRELTELKGEQHWPCKIGRSETGAGQRIREQTGYAPEQPHYALLIRTDQSQQLESHLHGFLASRGRRLPNAIGTEWFNTNPEEVLALAVETIWVTAAGAQDAA